MKWMETRTIEGFSTNTGLAKYLVMIIIMMINFICIAPVTMGSFRTASFLTQLKGACTDRNHLRNIII